MSELGEYLPILDVPGKAEITLESVSVLSSDVRAANMIISQLLARIGLGPGKHDISILESSCSVLGGLASFNIVSQLCFGPEPREVARFCADLGETVRIRCGQALGAVIREPRDHYKRFFECEYPLVAKKTSEEPSSEV